MPEASLDGGLLLPPSTRLLHIGPPKTGTTALQHAAATARRKMASAGVIYPGTEVNHRRPIYAFLQRPERPAASESRVDANKAPPIDEWYRLISEVNNNPASRSLISHETASTATDEQARRIVKDLGRDLTHVVITLRPLERFLIARWIEMLKEGESTTFEHWLERLFGLSGAPLPAVMQRYLDVGQLVSRWSAAIGPRNVTVVVVDSAEKTLLTDAFERLLGLPASTLQLAAKSGSATNRSMSAIEAEMFRQVNSAVYNDAKMPWQLYLDVIRSGAVKRVLENRVPAEGEPRVAMPKWAAERTQEYASRYVEVIKDSGVRVIGDISRLKSRANQESAGQGIPQIGEELAALATVGAFEGALRNHRRTQNLLRQAKGSVDRRAPAPEAEQGSEMVTTVGLGAAKGLGSHDKSPSEIARIYSAWQLLSALYRKTRGRTLSSVARLTRAGGRATK